MIAASIVFQQFPTVVSFILVFNVLFSSLFWRYGRQTETRTGRQAHALFDRPHVVFMSRNHGQFAHHQIFDKPDRHHWYMSTSKKLAQEANPGRLPPWNFSFILTTLLSVVAARKILFFLLYFTGGRKSEACAVQGRIQDFLIGGGN